MEYREIVAVTGIGGLFQLLTTKSDGAIVRNISDKTTKFISARVHNVTPLESIEIYTTGDNVRLHDVFRKMKESEGKVPPIDSKADNNAIKAYFDKVFPDFDGERVYVSDMKKMLKWYELLGSNDLLHFEDKAEESEAGEEASAEEAKPAKKAKAKEEAPAEEAEAKPAKKARAKKAAEPAADGEEPAPKKTARKKKTEE